MGDYCCSWCRVQVYNRISYHTMDCPQVTGVYPAKPGAVCAGCEEPIEAYTHMDDGMGGLLCVCLGCAAGEALIS